MQPSTPTPRYELELWINGVLVGDVSKLAKNRNYKLRRNATEELTFSMDLTAFEAYCEQAGRQPSAMLEPYVTDIRVKRNGNYKFGVHVVDTPFSLDESGAQINVRATGFLDLFADRYVTKSYDNDESTDIARDLLAETQSGDVTNDFGVIDGGSQYATGVLRVRNYIDQNVRDAVVNLTSLIDGNFDFRFTHDRKFETFERLGSSRPGSKFTYPYNVKGMDVAKTALNLYNYIIGIGSGFGEEAIRSIASDNDSRLNYKTRQKIVTFNSVSVQETLDENTSAYLDRVRQILLLPTIKVDGAFCDLDIIGVGDTVPIEVQGHPALPLNGTFRIEQIEVGLDDNDAEDIRLTIDDYGVTEVL